MNDQHDDALITLYQKARQEQPSELLDRRIRKAAQRRINRDKKRWVWGLSTAAVLVLSFSVVFDVSEFESEPMQSIIQEKASAHSQALNDVIPEAKSEPESPAVLSKPDFASREVMPEEMDEMPLRKKKSKEQRSVEKIISSTRHSIDYWLERESYKPQFEKDSVALELDIPVLPVELQALLNLHTGLSGEITPAGLITIYSENKLILTLSSTGGKFRFKAWPGSEKLGVKVTWSIKPEQLNECNRQGVYVSCSLNEQVQGLFEQDRLDHIRWFVVKND